MILNIDTVLAIVISAAIAVLYTLMGGLVSVAYTDVFQITFIAFGLVTTTCFPFFSYVFLGCISIPDDNSTLKYELPSFSGVS